jgi:hypothetical protein
MLSVKLNLMGSLLNKHTLWAKDDEAYIDCINLELGISNWCQGFLYDLKFKLSLTKGHEVK